MIPHQARFVKGDREIFCGFFCVRETGEGAHVGNVPHGSNASVCFSFTISRFVVICCKFHRIFYIVPIDNREIPCYTMIRGGKSYHTACAAACIERRRRKGRAQEVRQMSETE